MKTSKIILFLTALVLLSYQGFSQNWQLVWQDEFNYTGLPDPNKWGYDVGAGGWGNGEAQYYNNARRENSRVENGNLVLEARRDWAGAEYSSARLVSRNKGDWTYGRVEVRAKIPVGQGLWPAIWMLPTDWAYGGWPASGEIDIMESFALGGLKYDKVEANIHTKAYNHTIGTNKGAAITGLSNIEQNYHVYGVSWYENKMVFDVDGREYFTFNNEGGWQKWPYDKKFHLIMNIAVGGSLGTWIAPEIFPKRMLVDYVRVYKNNGGNPNPQPGGVATVYKDCNYGGYAIGLPAGDYNYGALYVRGVGNEDISSLKVNSGYEIQLFEHDNFTGSSITFNANNSCLVANGWNDRTTSLKIRAVSSSFTRTIQAEDYSAMLGVQKEPTTDAGGGQNVGYIDNGDWMAYNSINFPTSGKYKVEYRVASLNGGSRLSLDLNAGTIQLGAVNIPSTGGWQNWTTVSHTVNINAGTYNVGIFAATGGFNLNWIRFTKVNARMDSELADEAPAQESVVLYPSPTEGDLTISLAGGIESASASIYDVYGNLVKTAALTNNTTLDVSEFAAGVYVLSVTSEAGTTTKRFIKK